MKRLITILFTASLFAGASAQYIDGVKIEDLEKGATAIKAEAAKGYPDTAQWTFKGMAGLNISQAYFKNWSGGGDNTFALNAYFNSGLYYRKGKSAWDNDLSLEFGQVYGIYDKTTKDGEWRKNADKIDFTSKYGYAINPKLFWTGLVNFNSQFAKGYNYPNDSIYISKFMAPGYVTVSVGLDYKPLNSLSIFVSPATGRFTFVLDDDLSDAGAFGVEKGDKMRAQIGAYAKFMYNADIMTNVNLNTKLELFSAYDEDFINHTDVNWEVVIGMKINKYLTATLSTTLKYDDDVKYIDEDGNERGARIQFKEILGVGLAYKF